MGDFEDRFADSWKHYVITAAEYTPFREVLKQEGKAYYFPSIIQCTALLSIEKQVHEIRFNVYTFFVADITKKKHDEEAASRFPEEEGLFVGQRPFVQNKCLHKMENRLINEGDQVCINCCLILNYSI